MATSWTKREGLGNWYLLMEDGDKLLQEDDNGIYWQTLTAFTDRTEPSATSWTDRTQPSATSWTDRTEPDATSWTDRTQPGATSWTKRSEP